MSKWIPVTKQMPMTGQNVLLCDNEGGIFIGSYIDYEEEDADPFWVFQHDDEDFCFDEPIAWMPLPEHYVEDETDWFDAEVTDKSKDSITVEIKVNADHVRDFKNAILERVLEIIDSEGIKLQLGGYGAIPKYYVECIKSEIEKLRGEEQ